MRNGDIVTQKLHANTGNTGYTLTPNDTICSRPVKCVRYPYPTSGYGYTHRPLVDILKRLYKKLCLGSTCLGVLDSDDFSKLSDSEHHLHIDELFI